MVSRARVPLWRSLREVLWRSLSSASAARRRRDARARAAVVGVATAISAARSRALHRADPAAARGVVGPEPQAHGEWGRCFASARAAAAYYLVRAGGNALQANTQQPAASRGSATCAHATRQRAAPGRQQPASRRPGSAARWSARRSRSGRRACRRREQVDACELALGALLMQNGCRRRAVAKGDFTAQYPNELTFRKGEYMFVLQSMQVCGPRGDRVCSAERYCCRRAGSSVTSTDGLGSSRRPSSNMCRKGLSQSREDEMEKRGGVKHVK